ncbi:unnamed protein product [Blepharisma stoltei]|uniref:C2H2-type domain-containing protein n=1 Tax=Blepharisma stoltei TaxID=1481888 RepID=A0AAU9J2J6_9CILI|nr:unnamed protein product [Blepharisma stoltei]
MTTAHIPHLKCISTSQHTDYCCDLCGIGFESPLQYRDHLIQDFELDRDSISFLHFRLGLELSTEVPDSPASVDSCSTAESENDELECPTCGKFFKGHKGLQQHIGKAHSSKDKGVTCSICHKTFKHQHALTFHDRQVHQKATRVTCGICGLSVYNKYMLIKHISKQHPA